MLLRRRKIYLFRIILFINMLSALVSANADPRLDKFIRDFDRLGEKWLSFHDPITVMEQSPQYQQQVKMVVVVTHFLHLAQFMYTQGQVLLGANRQY